MINKLDTFDLRDASAPDLGIGVAVASVLTGERPRLGFSFRAAIDPLVATRFEEVAAVAERFATREVRAIARLEVAKLCLQRPTK